MTTNASAKKIVVPTDGSECSLRALQVAINRCKATGAALHLINVQPPITSGNVRMFISQDTIKHYHEDESKQAMAAAVRLLEQQQMPFVPVARVGHPFEVIGAYADPVTDDEIVMGSRGMSPIGNLVMGSVATQVVHVARVPVTLVK